MCIYIYIYKTDRLTKIQKCAIPGMPALDSASDYFSYFKGTKILI